MRIQPYFLLPFLLVAVSPVLAKSENCVPDTGCPAEQGPPACCKPPPCEFWTALEEARAKKQIISSARFSHTDPDFATTEQQFEKFSKQVTDEIRKIRKKFPKCKLKGERKNPPIFSVDAENKDCRIMTNVGQTFKQLDLSDAKQVLDGCEELIEAKYESANVGATYCALEAASPEDRMRQRVDRSEREMTVLEDQLFRYWSVCTIAPDIEIPEIITKNSVDVLKRFGFKNKWAPKPAKRAGKSRMAR
jgi:hypothetical protein